MRIKETNTNVLRRKCANSIVKIENKEGIGKTQQKTQLFEEKKVTIFTNRGAQLCIPEKD